MMNSDKPVYKQRWFIVGLAYSLRSLEAENNDNAEAYQVYEQCLAHGLYGDRPFNKNYRSQMDRFAMYWNKLKIYDSEGYIEARDYYFA